MRLNKGLFRLILPALVLILIIIGVPAMVAQADPGWYNVSWSYRKEITIDNTKVTATLAYFPVLISLAPNDDLASNAKDYGADILFTDSDGTTKLSHEIEKFDGGTGELVAWVKIPVLSSSADTVIYMYYGNGGAGDQQDATNVWDDNYKMVQHLQETTGGTNAIEDSTANTNHGTDNNTPTLGATGQIDGAISFDGADDIIDYGSGNSLKMTDALTIELWVNRTDNTTFERFLSHSIDTSNYAYEVGVDVTEPHKWRFRLNNDAVTLKTAMGGSPGQWLYLVVTYDKDAGGTNEIKMYENGSLIGSLDYSTAMANHGNLETNRQGKSDGWCKSTIDEVRISDTARSADWLLTSYNNQNSPATFFTMGVAGTGAPTAVGGIIYPVNKALVLLPWLCLFAVLSLVITTGAFHLRKRA